MAPDLSQISSNDLLAALGQRTAPTQSPISDLSTISSADLLSSLAKPQRSWADTGADFLRSAVHGVTNAGTLAQTVLNPFDTLGAKISSALTGVYNPGQSEQTQNEVENLVSSPKYTRASLGERAIGKGIEMTPMAVFGGGVAPAFLSGAVGEIGKEAGYPEWVGQIIGGMAPTALKASIQPFTAVGREQIAGRQLMDVLGEDGAKRLENYAPSIFGAKTTAEVAQSPSMANIEKTLAQQLGQEQNSLLQKAASRQANRTSLLEQFSDAPLKTITNDIRGQKIRGLGLDDIEAADRVTKEAWDNVGKMGLKINIEGAAEDIAKTATKLETPLGYSRDANKLLAAIEGRNSLTIEEYQKFRSAAGKVLVDAVNDPTEQSLMMSFRENLDNAAKKLAKTPTMAGSKIEALKDAIATTRDFKQTFKTRSVKEIFKKGEGGFVMNDSSIPRRIIASPEAAKEFTNAFESNSEMMQMARGGLLDEITKGNPDTWVKQFNQYRPQARALFGKDFLRIKNVFDDLSSELSVGTLAQQATGRGSITAQRLSAAQYLNEPSRVVNLLSTWGPSIGGAIGLSGGQATTIAGAVIGGGLQALAKKSQKELAQLMLKAAQDPEMAKLLTSKASPEVIKTILPRLAFLASPQGNKSEQLNSELFQKGLGANLLPSNLQSLGKETKEASQPMKENRKINSGGQTYPQNTPTPEPTQQQSISRSDVGYLVEQQHPFIRAMITQESGGKQSAVSPKGARGLMQLMPGTAKELGVNPYNPIENLKGGIRYISQQIQKYSDPKIALAAYNYGPGAIDRKLSLLKKRGQAATWANLKPLLPAETKQYVTNIMSNYSRMV